MGSRLISMRGDGPWRGRSTRQVSDRMERRQLRIEGGYVAGDGHTINAIPGFHTIFDPTEVNNQNGYERVAIDVIRPVIASAPTDLYYYTYRGETAGRTQTLLCRSEPTKIHFFEQFRNQTFIVGESGPRKCLILSAARVELTITFEAVVGGFWRITLSGNPGAYTAADAAGAGLNGLAVGDIVWPEIVSTAFDVTTLNNRAHLVTAIAGNQVTLQTTAPMADHGSTIATGNLWRVRPNRTNQYSPNGVLLSEPNEYQRIDDPDALTCWRIADPLDLENPASMRCNPAWVANRQRDCGDDPIASQREGAVLIAGSPAAHISRRRQRVLPYRLNPDLAGDRLMIAAPGYSCLFQIPLIVPQEGESWPATPSGWSANQGRGVLWPSNDVHDKPRSAGVPKAVLVDSNYTSPPTSPGAPLPYNFQVLPRAAAGTYWPAGVYHIAVAYRDDATGEEGLASETVILTIPTPPGGVSGYDIQLVVLHPGYLFPETLALTLNIYMKPPGSAALGFYMSLPFGRAAAAASTTPMMSAKYGYEVTPAETPEAVISARTLLIPAPINTSPPSAAIDFTRPPPRSRQMPRGAECVRTIRSITMSVGHSGTHGNVAELQRAMMSSLYSETASPYSWNHHAEVQVFGLTTPAVDYTPNTGPAAEVMGGSFGIGSRYFPSAYQGIEVWSRELFPEPRKILAIGFVHNHRTHNAAAGVLDRYTMHAQRLRMEEPVFSRDIGTPGSPAFQFNFNKETFLVHFRGQVQVSEPGAPTTMLTSAIQFLDANKDDDGLAIGQFQSGAILCSKRETFYLNWALSPIGQVPQLLHAEIGCIATNAMVEIDGGLAWISERGPVAAGGTGVQFVGGDVEEDFTGSRRRYVTDSKGMMRHAWAHHDRARGIVWWGLRTNVAVDAAAFLAAPDGAKSKFACDEVLIWNYRVGAFSRWRPPMGGIFWMRSLVDKNGDTYTAFLGGDWRGYAMNDVWHDTNRRVLRGNPTTNSPTPTSTLVLDVTWGTDTVGGGGGTARGAADNLLRIGMPWVQYRVGNGTDPLVRVSSGFVLTLDPVTQTIALDQSVTYGTDDIFEFGIRQDIVVESAFAGDGIDNIEVDSVQVRYALHSDQHLTDAAFARATVRKSDLQTDGLDRPFTANPDDHDDDTQGWRMLGTATVPPTAARRVLAEGRASAPEISVKVEVSGAAQVRIADILLEIGSVT